ncbi:M23 family metallopeptidase [Breoghania sp.]|uniref:M23 family metallopeptidase n=1 Tax=Breoghania sp. TaxID=2065378 RepID=UPI00262A4BF3|nr:M23 family metallopeptidase [Breoghania sp.]MDJ0929574.1 M23 family metallopeptidase [Breoghania sp.]
MHTGLNLRAPYGTPVQATAAGTVVSTGHKCGYGLMVEIDHGNGVVTRYGHLSHILVSEGDTVSADEVIGKVGNTDRSTDTHLHYETRISSDPVDPQTFLNAGEKLAGIL